MGWRVKITAGLPNRCGKPVHTGTPNSHFHAIDVTMPGYETQGATSRLDGPFAGSECKTAHAERKGALKGPIGKLP